MRVRKQADAIDPRLIFRVYAVLVGVGGFILLAWGQIWFGSDIPGQPYGKAALIRVAGSGLMAAGCFAEALTRVTDPAAGRRALAWFGVGHGIVGQILMLQGVAIGGPSSANWLEFLFNGTAFLFLYLYWTAEGERIAPRPTITSLFSGQGATPTERLHSAYEEQIRQAAGQEERNRLARELHDSVKQQVFAIQTSAATAEVRFETDRAGARAALAEVRSAARDTMTEMEVMLDQLRAAPLENAGLIEALKRQCEALGFRTGTHVEFGFDQLPPNEDLPPGTHQTIFRVAQEALANVARHARANNVKVYLSASGGWIRLVVEDDGAGFEPQKTLRGMGIANMRERAEEFGGFLDLETAPRGGTTIKLSIPYEIASTREHSRRALGYGVLTMVVAAIAIWTRSGLQAIIALACGFAACRQVVAWRRVKKRSRSDDHRAG